MYTGFSIQNISGIKAYAYLDLASTPVIISLDSSEGAAGNARAEITLHVENRELAAALVKAINAAVAECNTAVAACTAEPAPDMHSEEFSDVNQF